MLTTKSIATNYTLDILDIQDFKNYYYENKDLFTPSAMNAFLKTLDIPPKFFKEQPEETQDELLNNREYFVAERKKFIGKVIVILKSLNGEILNACRMGKAEAEEKYEALNTIEDVKNKFEHRSFVKEGYISLVISENIAKDKENAVLVVDFPILLNKKPVIHKATYKLPNNESTAPVEHIHYLESVEVELGEEYSNIKEAIDDNLDYVEDGGFIRDEAQDILREPELVTLALVELNIIPRSLNIKMIDYLTKNTKGTLNTRSLESLVLDFDEELRKYKQVTNLRSVIGEGVLTYLNSDTFKELEEALNSEKDELVTI